MGDKFNNGSEFSASSSSSSSSSWSLLRSEEHTSELQSQSNLVCRLLLEKKKHTNTHSGAPSVTYRKRVQQQRDCDSPISSILLLATCTWDMMQHEAELSSMSDIVLYTN